MNQLSETKIHLWVAILIALGVMCAAAALTYYYLHSKTDRYNVRVSGAPDREDFQYGSWPSLANPDFFKQVKDQFIAEQADFVEVDLTEMQLRVHKQGQVALEVPVLTKGREGSWWETPSGLYRAEDKRENHFSSLGEVYLPWTVPFQGNFFIHGWPYYPDGTPVTSSYSGGCIRLDTEDAKRVYDLIEVSMPILVHENQYAADEFSYTTSAPDITATSYLAADLKNNFVFLEEGATASQPLSEVTALLTALVAGEYVDIEKQITISERMLVATDVPRLAPGMSASVYDLLFPLLQESSHEAGKALASFLGESYFVTLMNRKAAAVGMNDTELVDAHGSDENTGTAEDVFRLAKYLYNNRTFVLDISAGKARTDIYGVPQFADLANHNTMHENPAYLGGKLGTNDTGRENALVILEVPFNTETRPIAFVVLGSVNAADDIARMRAYITDAYRADTSE